jgi:hypothetical protein
MLVNIESISPKTFQAVKLLHKKAVYPGKNQKI